MSGGRGFSLLELLIVLAIMAGLAALVFPSLSRPLAENEVGRAAADVRDAITDCRNEAVMSQELRLLHFEANGATVTWGDWQTLTAAALGTPESMPGLDATSTGSGDTDRTITSANSPAKLSVLRLPDEIVIERVNWRSAVGEDQLRDIAGDAPANLERAWYIPCLPTGQSKDCQIILRDRLTGSRCALHVDGVLSMIRVERLPSVTDGGRAGQIARESDPSSHSTAAFPTGVDPGGLP